MVTAKAINDNWSEYDKKVAQCHLANYGIIFLDSYGCPIDDEYATEELYEAYYSSAK
ncbi:hypothetical protein LKD70_17480 [Ruminococcus sp. CLA-AA-H200]|uniref:Uncharacterized protein n=1 Tax=Ruminococcus turbiniformis TaxID=2881258 RepID=A0ABS8G1S6_9FIRM|nr:hypothetical protein [Ruminococcus turbiniformis]MCC2256176.1 hypothetical protein [Ruminococcus turbiniformis]